MPYARVGATCEEASAPGTWYSGGRARVAELVDALDLGSSV